MRRREIQNFTLKLSDLKEYEMAKEERLIKNNPDANTSKSEMKTPGISAAQLFPKIGPKSKQDIRNRIGLPME
jgi:hypothetical protein